MWILSCKLTHLFEIMCHLYFGRDKLFNYKYVHIVLANVHHLNVHFLSFCFLYSFARTALIGCGLEHALGAVLVCEMWWFWNLWWLGYIDILYYLQYNWPNGILIFSLIFFQFALRIIELDVEWVEWCPHFLCLNLLFLLKTKSQSFTVPHKHFIISD